MTWKVGILVVGSLYWDPLREPWRKKYLTDDEGTLVKAPICYGRKSSLRQHTYTMVFSPALDQEALGTARVKQCRAQISSPEELIAEARQLWIAENLSARRPTWTPAANDPTLSAYWGCVALRAHPHFLDQADIAPADRTQRERLSPLWAATFREEWNKRKTLEQGRRPAERHEGPVPCSVYAPPDGSKSAVNDDGMLQLSWPNLEDPNSQLEMFDLLLATATTPTLDPHTGGYPSIPTIIQAWTNAQDEFYYFRCNQRYRFTTYQDQTIKAAFPHLMTKSCKFELQGHS
jgi:hypothetical protein